MGTHHRIGTIALFVSLSLLTASAQVKPGEVRHSIQSSSSGITWAMQAMQALTGGNPVSTVSESGTVKRTLGSGEEQGAIALQSSGIMASEVDITTDRGVRSEIRTMSGSYPAGVWIGLTENATP